MRTGYVLLEHLFVVWVAKRQTTNKTHVHAHTQVHTHTHTHTHTQIKLWRTPVNILMLYWQGICLCSVKFQQKCATVMYPPPTVISFPRMF